MGSRDSPGRKALRMGDSESKECHKVKARLTINPKDGGNVTLAPEAGAAPSRDILGM